MSRRRLDEVAGGSALPVGGRSGDAPGGGQDGPEPAWPHVPPRGSGPLYVKHRLTGTPVEPVLLQVGWALSAVRRRRHPELSGMYLEDRRMRTVLAHLIQPDWSCVDVGAHIGSVLVQLLRSAPLGQHIAFEPSPWKARWLASRFGAVEVQQVAVGDASGHADFHEDMEWAGFSGLGRRGRRSRTYRVPVETLDRAIGQRPVQFIKLDVEGGELPALKGATATLERCRPTLLFECGPPAALEPFGYERGDLHEFLVRDTGYDVYSLEDFLYGREPMSPAEFRKAGTYPFPGFNYIALAVGTPVTRLL